MTLRNHLPVGILCLCLANLFFCRGCAIPNTQSGTSYSSERMSFSSKITHATRSSTFGIDTVEIHIVVEGRGVPLGTSAYSNLQIYGSSHLFAEDTWRNLGGEESGWPTRYTVRADYEDNSPTSGTVVIVVTASDFAHPSHGSVLYRTRHSFSWE